MPSKLSQAQLSLALSALALTLACGGGSGASASASSAAPQPRPQVNPATAEPFWATDTPIRPSIAPLFRTAAPSGNVIALNAEEQAELTRSAASPAAPAEAPAPLAAPLAPQLRIVVGLRSFSYHQDSTTTLQPLDLSAATIQALVPNASGGFDTLSGVGHSDGTFSIENVPEGYYWQRFGNSYVWTSANYLDWSQDLFGRADGVYPSNPSTLSIGATGLNAWQGTDELVWAAPNQGTALSLPLTSSSLTNPPAVGATALSGFAMNFTGADLSFPLLDATKGDQGYLNQLTTRSAGGESYRALAKSYVVPPTTMTDGGTSAVSGGFLDIPQSATLRLNVQRSAFVAFAPAVNPSATPAGSFFFAYAYPLPSTYGLPYDAFQLLDYTSPNTGDVDLGDLPYGNPFPAGWSIAAEAYQAFNVSYLAPGATNPLVLTRYSYQATTTLPTAAAPMTPLLGPVQNPKINGKDLFSNQISVGTSPTLSWNAPAVGSASGYVVTCYKVSASGPDTVVQVAGRFRTQTTSIKLPPTILAAGNTYCFTIAAIRATGVNFASTPYRTSLPYAFTTCMSALVAP